MYDLLYKSYIDPTAVSTDNSLEFYGIISRLGFYTIVETDFEASSLDVLMTYRQRDVVEKSFDDPLDWLAIIFV